MEVQGALLKAAERNLLGGGDFLTADGVGAGLRAGPRTLHSLLRPCLTISCLTGVRTFVDSGRCCFSPSSFKEPDAVPATVGRERHAARARLSCCWRPSALPSPPLCPPVSGSSCLSADAALCASCPGHRCIFPRLYCTVKSPLFCSFNDICVCEKYYNLLQYRTV